MLPRMASFGFGHTFYHVSSSELFASYVGNRGGGAGELVLDLGQFSQAVLEASHRLQHAPAKVEFQAPADSAARCVAPGCGSARNTVLVRDAIHALDGVRQRDRGQEFLKMSRQSFARAKAVSYTRSRHSSPDLREKNQKGGPLRCSAAIRLLPQGRSGDQPEPTIVSGSPVKRLPRTKVERNLKCASSHPGC